MQWSRNSCSDTWHHDGGDDDGDDDADEDEDDGDANVDDNDDDDADDHDDHEDDDENNDDDEAHSPPRHRLYPSPENYHSSDRLSSIILPTILKLYFFT